MSTVRIPAKKVMEPGMTITDIKNIWDYVDIIVEEETPKVPEIKMPSFFEDEFVDEYYDEDLYEFDDDENVRWGGEIYRDDDYRDAFEDEPEAYWGREG